MSDIRAMEHGPQTDNVTKASVRRSREAWYAAVNAFLAHTLSCRECAFDSSRPVGHRSTYCPVATSLHARDVHACRKLESDEMALAMAPPKVRRKPKAPVRPRARGDIEVQYMVQIQSMLYARPQCSCDLCVYWASCIALTAAEEDPLVSKLTLMRIGVSVPDFLRPVGTGARQSLERGIRRQGSQFASIHAPQANPVPEQLLEPSSVPWHAEPIDRWRTSDKVGPPAPGAEMFSSPLPHDAPKSGAVQP